MEDISGKSFLIAFWRNKLEFYLSVSSFKGVKYLSYNNSIGRRCFWGILVLFGFVFMTFQIYRSAEQYFDRKVTTDVKYDIKDSLYFPKITICSENRYPLKIANMFSKIQIITS